MMGTASRSLNVLSLAWCLAGVVALLGAVPAAQAAGPPRDRAFGSGRNADFSSFQFSQSSGPSGEHPTGQSTTVFQGETYTGSPGSTGCLHVRGHKATWAGRLAPNPNYSYGKATVIDNGPRGDEFFAQGYQEPVDCSTPVVTFGGPLIAGNITVVDAPGKPSDGGPGTDTPTPPRRPRPALAILTRRPMLTSRGTVRIRIACHRRRVPCRGRLHLRTAHGTTRGNRYWRDPARRGTVAVGVRRRDITTIHTGHTVRASLVAREYGRVVARRRIIIRPRRSSLHR